MFIIMAFGVLIYYMPFYFQAARGFSPRQSGIYILALSIPDTVVALAVGAVAACSGHYVPFMVASAVLMAIGSGLFSQIQVSTDMAYITGLQLIVSLGLGIGVQLPLSAVRNVLDEPDVPAGEALVLFCLSLGFALAFPIAQTIFMNTLSSQLATRLNPSRVAEIIEMGPSKVNADHMKNDILSFVAQSYGKAISTAFYVSIAASALALIAASAMEWRKLEREEDIGITGGVLTDRPPSHLEGDNDASQQEKRIPLTPAKTVSSCGPSVDLSQRSSR